MSFTSSEKLPQVNYWWRVIYLRKTNLVQVPDQNQNMRHMNSSHYGPPPTLARKEEGSPVWDDKRGKFMGGGRGGFGGGRGGEGNSRQEGRGFGGGGGFGRDERKGGGEQRRVGGSGYGGAAEDWSKPGPRNERLEEELFGAQEQPHSHSGINFDK